MAQVAEPRSLGDMAEPTSPTGGEMSGRLRRAIDAVDSNARWVLAVFLFVDAALLLYMGRELTFFYDDWDFVTHDYGGGLHSLLAAHVGNISVFPVAAYKVLFHLVGLNHYGVFRLVVVVLHLLAAGMIFTLASRRIANVPALLATALILFLGAAWEDLLWAFQIGYLLSIVGGLAAWLLLERRDRLGDLLATGCLVLAIGSSSLGIPLVIGVAVELAWRREWGRCWVILVPALLYVAWYLGYGESEATRNSLINAPGFAMDLAGAAVGALTGRGLDWGRPLALLGLLLLLRSLTGPVAISARLAGLLATGISLWVITAMARSTTSDPATSRYVYLGAVVVVLVGVETLRGFAFTPRATGMAALLVGLCAVTGLTALHNGAEGLRSTSVAVMAELGALELAANYVPSGYQPDPQRAPQVVAGPYLHTVRAIGSTPADTPAEIIASNTTVRTEVDENLIKLEAVTLTPTAVSGTLSRRYPLLANVVGSQPVRGQNCWSTTAVESGTFTEFLLPTRGILIRARSQTVQVTVRRFSPSLGGLQLGVLTPRQFAVVKAPVDSSGRPWFIRIASGASTDVCGVG